MGWSFGYILYKFFNEFSKNIVLNFVFFNLAAFGGIFGLCLGGSVISLVEMVYYFTLRLYNRIISIRKQDGHSLTRQVTAELTNNKSNYTTITNTNNNNNAQRKLVQKFDLNTQQQSKLQMFGKNVGSPATTTMASYYHNGVGGGRGDVAFMYKK